MEVRISKLVKNYFKYEILHIMFILCNIVFNSFVKTIVYTKLLCRSLPKILRSKRNLTAFFMYNCVPLKTGLLC